jgi:hypothetical protein
LVENHAIALPVTAGDGCAGRAKGCEAKRQGHAVPYGCAQMENVVSDCTRSLMAGLGASHAAIAMPRRQAIDQKEFLNSAVAANVDAMSCRNDTMSGGVTSLCLCARNSVVM